MTQKITFEIPTSYDDAEIKKAIKSVAQSIPAQYDDSELRKKINKLESAIPTQYDDKKIKKQLADIKASIPSNFDDSDIKNKIEYLELQINESEVARELQANKDSIFEMKAIIETLTTELTELRTATAANQKEIRSNRQTAGYQIDVINQKVNKITEIK